ncbi:MAG: COX15/CtaA family protein [Acidobacteriota bacterium]|nr:COX15/CtaA family protein [Acidobacteriota bacterium]
MNWLHAYACLLAVATVVLIAAGGMVTSTGSGLSVPDWPNSYGYFMFAFPLSNMVGGIFYEHGHRLIASIVGMLTIGLVIWLWLDEPRRWIRRFAAIALAAVVLQGLLGGLTVLYFLPTPISVSHAGVAQIFFCLTVCLALFTSRSWHDSGSQADLSIHRSVSHDRTMVRLATGLPVLLYLQILIGATMRHTGSGLAIPDFPLVFGGLLPPIWNFGIAVHFVHRVGAIGAALMILATLGHLLAHHRTRHDLLRPSWSLVLLVIIQVGLGGWTIWSQRAPLVNTAHVVTGALVLATSLVLGLRVNRHRFPDANPLGLPTPSTGTST